MKNATRLSITAIVLGASASLPLAHADSLDLRFHDRNVGVGINVGAPTRYIQVAPVAPPACERRTGYWGTDGYRTVWVESSWGYPQQRWERTNWRDNRRWDDQRRDERGDREHSDREHGDRDRHEHEWHENHDRRDWR